MPRTTIYIRNEDYDKWKLIENKSELISQAINRSVITPIVKDNGTVNTHQEIPIESLERECCDEAARCKHWEWDGVNDVWKNTLSGRKVAV